MKLMGMMPVRNEAWAVGLSLRVALRWADEMVVLLHACTDNSERIVRDVLREHPDRVTILRDMCGTWDEMPQRQRMLESARERGATHLAIIDADEVLTGNMLHPGPLGSNIRQASWLTGIEGNGEQCSKILQLPGYNLRGGINQYHNNGVWGNRWFSTAFADAPDLGWSGDKFHYREPGPRKLTPYQPIQQGEGGTMHLWGASERRLIAKHAHYKITERLRWPHKDVATIDKMYSLSVKGDPADPNYGTPETWTYAPVPESWWAPYADLMQYLDVDAEPWQEEECRRLVAQHGRETFAGLDLFGVA